MTKEKIIEELNKTKFAYEGMYSDLKECIDNLLSLQKQEIVKEIEEDYIRWVLAENIKEYIRRHKESKDKIK